MWGASCTPTSYMRTPGGYKKKNKKKHSPLVWVSPSRCWASHPHSPAHHMCRGHPRWKGVTQGESIAVRRGTWCHLALNDHEGQNKWVQMRLASSMMLNNIEYLSWDISGSSAQTCKSALILFHNNSRRHHPASSLSSKAPLSMYPHLGQGLLTEEVGG